jgi:hypothetical protein
MGQWTADKFRACIENREFGVLAGLYADDAVLDVTIGHWRYQRQGPQAIAEQYREDYPVPPVIDRWRERPTDWGSVVEVEARLLDERGETFYRWVHLFTVSDGLIVEDAIYCSGAWSEAERDRWRREAPMVRP